MKHKLIHFLFILIVISQPLKGLFAQVAKKSEKNDQIQWSFKDLSFDTSKKIIVVRSVSKKRVSLDIIRTVFIKVDTNTIEWSFKIKDIIYFDNKTHNQIFNFQDQHLDTFEILQVLKNFDGAINLLETNIGMYNPIQVDSVKTKSYIANLPVYDPNPDNDEDKNFKKIILIPNFTIGYSYTTVSVDTAYFSKPDELTKRNQNQIRKVGYNCGIAVGFRPYKNHIIFIEGYYQVMGFESKYYTVDWRTGFLTNPNSISTKYIFKNMTVGVGYLFAPIPQDGIKVSYLIQGEVYYSINSGKAYEAKGYENTYNSIFIKKDRFGAKIGIGLSYKFSNFTTLKLLPVYQWDFDSVNKGQLSTRLKMFGLNTGLIFSL